MTISHCYKTTTHAQAHIQTRYLDLSQIFTLTAILHSSPLNKHSSINSLSRCVELFMPRKKRIPAVHHVHAPFGTQQARHDESDIFIRSYLSFRRICLEFVCFWLSESKQRIHTCGRLQNCLATHKSWRCVVGVFLSEFKG